MEELADTELCPCGRGIPYGQCCKTKGILWYKDGKVFHKCYGASLSEEALEVFENNCNSFIDLFGREPSNDDLILFDTSAHTNDFFVMNSLFCRILVFLKNGSMHITEQKA